jgi:hypothetical protein
MDERLIGHAAGARQAAETGEQAGIDTNGDELLGKRGFRPAHASCALQLRIGGFRHVGEIDFAIGQVSRHRPCVLCGSLAAR